MNIEILEFYLTLLDQEREILTGTLRIKLCGLGIHILGAYVSRRKNSWYFSLPGRKGVHHETGESVRYPFIVFEDQEEQRALIEAIKEQGRIFVEKRLADTNNPLVVPQKTKTLSNRVGHGKGIDNLTKVKEMTSMEKTTTPIKSKGWFTPPPRKALHRNSKS